MNSQQPSPKPSPGGKRPAGQGRLQRKPDTKPPRYWTSWLDILKRAMHEDRDERGEPPDLSVEEVLAWADAFHERNGYWPRHQSGPIPEAPGETWLLVAAAMALGRRGFPSGGSIPRFLGEHRGRSNRRDQKFTVDDVLAWADAWYARTGDWPHAQLGRIPGGGGVSWSIVDDALRLGRGMIPGHSSLARFLASRRGVFRIPPLNDSVRKPSWRPQERQARPPRRDVPGQPA